MSAPSKAGVGAPCGAPFAVAHDDSAAAPAAGVKAAEGAPSGAEHGEAARRALMPARTLPSSPSDGDATSLPPSAEQVAETPPVEKVATRSSITGSQTPPASPGAGDVGDAIARSSSDGDPRGGGEENTTPPPLRVLDHRLDAITVGYKAWLDENTLRWFQATHDRMTGTVPIEQPASTGDDFDADVEAAISAAEIAIGQAGPGRVSRAPFSIGPFPFALRVDRPRGGAYLLENGDCTLLVGLRENGWDVEVKWKAIAIATNGREECFAIGRAIVDELRSMAPHSESGGTNRLHRPEVEERLRRIDLCADVDGMPDTETRRWVMRAKKQGEYLVRSYLNGTEYVTGRTFGEGGDLMARVYNKTLQLAQVYAPDSEETLTLHGCWQRQGWDGKTPLTRVEFQIRRGGLDTFGIDAPDDLTDQKLREIWAYLTHDWLRCTDGGASRAERADVSPEWEIIQRVPFAAGTAAPLKRLHGRKRGATVEQAIGATFSALAADSALPVDCTESDVVFHLALAFARMLAERYTPEQLLVAIEGYRACVAEIHDAIRKGERPNVQLSPSVRKALRKRVEE